MRSCYEVFFIPYLFNKVLALLSAFKLVLSYYSLRLLKGKILETKDFDQIETAFVVRDNF